MMVTGVTVPLTRTPMHTAKANMLSMTCVVMLSNGPSNSARTDCEIPVSSQDRNITVARIAICDTRTADWTVRTNARSRNATKAWSDSAAPCLN